MCTVTTPLPAYDADAIVSRLPEITHIYGIFYLHEQRRCHCQPGLKIDDYEADRRALYHLSETRFIELYGVLSGFFRGAAY